MGATLEGVGITLILAASLIGFIATIWKLTIAVIEASEKEEEDENNNSEKQQYNGTDHSL